jgi:hypothetical protein
MLRPDHRPRLVPVALLVAALAVALATAGCAGRVVGPRDWTASAQLTSGRTYTVTARDNSGRIDNVEIDPAGLGIVPGIVNPPGLPNVVIVPWTGGACDQQTLITIASNGPGLALTVQTTVAPGACDAIGVGHALRLTASEALPAAAVSVRPAP